MAFADAMRRILLLLSLLCVTTVSASQASQRSRGSGFIGYGITMYKPTCATACRDSVNNPLDCNGTADHSNIMKRMGGMSMEKPSPECYATNDRFLQSVAYCISQHCANVEPWKIEHWWMRKIPGTTPSQPKPKESYQQTLARIEVPPNMTIPKTEMLMNDNTLVAEATYQANFNADGVFEKNEETHVRYGLILLTTGAAIPIALSLLRFIPFPKSLVSRFNAIFVDPPAFGQHHRTAWLNTFITPTRGQAFFITYLWVINIILCSVGYRTRQPNSWFDTPTLEISTYISYRTGVLSFANIPLLVLYAGRNNILLWVTNWSHSTFLLIHRWIAFICTLEACVHSAILLQIYCNTEGYDYMAESKSPYWVWGIVATLGLVVLLPTSILPLRKKFYEMFLAWHVVLSFVILIGCYYHVVLRFGHQWGYETWLLIAFAVWGFDRFARLARIARNGVKTARVTVVDEDYIRLEIPGVSAAGQAYLYFPTLTWRVWENHPFSIASSLADSRRDSISEDSSRSSSHDAEKSPSHEIRPVAAVRDGTLQTGRRHPHAPQVGLSFFIRTRTGTTAKLRSRKTLPVLIESSYGQNVFGDHGGTNISSYPNLICIAGGIGITAVLPILASHVGQSKLFWGVRTNALRGALHDNLAEPAYVGTEMHVSKGERLNLRAILEKEVKADQGAGTAIVVSGPPSMADEVRCIVSELTAKDQNAVIAFVEESYSW